MMTFLPYIALKLYHCWYFLLCLQMSSLSVACSDMRYVHGRAQHSALWMTSDRGDIFVHDADQYQLNELPTEMYVEI